MKELTPMTPKQKKILGIILCVLIFLMILDGLFGRKESNSSPEPTQDTPEGIFSALDIDCNNLQIIPSGSEVRVSFEYDSPAWDATHFVSEVLTDYVRFCQDAYDLEWIENVTFYVFAVFTDPKGNESTEKAIAICMPKDAFQTYNWSNIRYTPGIYDQVTSDCSLFDLHAGLARDVETDRVMYQGE